MKTALNWCFRTPRPNTVIQAAGSPGAGCADNSMRNSPSGPVGMRRKPGSSSLDSTASDCGIQASIQPSSTGAPVPSNNLPSMTTTAGGSEPAALASTAQRQPSCGNGPIVCVVVISLISSLPYRPMGVASRPRSTMFHS